MVQAADSPPPFSKKDIGILSGIMKKNHKENAVKKISWNDNWNFKKQGTAEARVITLPHDAMLEEKRDPKSPGGSAVACFPGGIYEYEKEIDVPAEWEQKHIVLEFEGVYRNSRVFVNGVEAGGAAYGYIPYFVCLDGKVNYGAVNTLKVMADNADLPNSRWYSGAGIYRPIWLWEGGKAFIFPEGVKVTPISYNPAKIRVEVVVSSEVEEVEVEVFDGTDSVKKISLSKSDKQREYAKDCTEAVTYSSEFEIANAKLWSDETPDLYTIHATAKAAGEAVDEVIDTFGIRVVEWSTKGLFVNGKSTLLRGGCVHHDNGILGAVSYKESEFRRVKMLKDAGYNAIRVSHNPAAKAMLEACDFYGMYVMDETWDMWYNKKNAYDYANYFIKNYKSDIKALIDRDYNHPSVIMYSIGNEVSEPATEKGVALTKEMVAMFHKLDSSRAVTGGFNLMIISRSAKGQGIYDEEKGGRDESNSDKMKGMNSTMFNMITSMVGTGMNKGANGKKADQITSPSLNVLDIAGYNYASGRYPLEGKAHPDRVILGSETFPQDIVKNWRMVKDYPYLVGDFMWTAWDYLGEAGIGAWAYTPDGKGFEKPYPWLLADVGAMDILGDPNGELFMAQAVWNLLAVPRIAVQPVNHPGVKPAKGTWRGTNAIPSWSWRNCEGNKAVVEVYTQGAAVELFLNGKKIKKAKVKDCRAVFKVKYESGELQAVAYGADGRKLGAAKLISATGTLVPRVTMDECVKKASEVKAGDIIYYNIDIAGENGVVESNADRKLTVTVEGGELLAFGSANPRTEEEFLSGTYTTYYGRALAIVRVIYPEALKLTVH